MSINLDNALIGSVFLMDLLLKNWGNFRKFRSKRKKLFCFGINFSDKSCKYIIKSLSYSWFLLSLIIVLYYLNDRVLSIIYNGVKSNFKVLLTKN